MTTREERWEEEVSSTEVRTTECHQDQSYRFSCTIHNLIHLPCPGSEKCLEMLSVV